MQDENLDELLDIDENDEEEIDEDDEDEDENGPVVVPEKKPKVTINERGAGRPKGSVSLKKNQKIDPFEFAIEWIQRKKDPVKMVIRKGGALLAELEFSDPSKTKYKSLKDVQKILGAGIYSFEVWSMTEKRKIYDYVDQILDLPKGLEDFVITEPSESDGMDGLDGLLRNLNKPSNGNGNGSQETSSNGQHEIHNHIPQPKSLVDHLKELAPLIVTLAPIIKGLMTPKVPDYVSIQEKMEEKLEKERKRIMDEQDRIDRKVKEALSEKMENYGMGPEKSTIEEVGEIVKSVSDIIREKSNVAQAQLKAQTIAKRPVRQNVQKPAPQKPQQQRPVNPRADLRKAIDAIIEKAVMGYNEEQLIEYVNSNESLKSIVKKYTKEDVALEAKDVLKLDDEGFAELKVMVENLYDVIQT